MHRERSTALGKRGGQRKTASGMAADHFLHNSCEGGHSGHTFGRLTSTEKLAEPPRPRRAASRPHCKERWDRTQGMGELPLKGGWAIPAVWHGRQGGLVKVLCCDQIHQDLCFTREDSHLKKSEKPLLELPVFSSISSTWGQAVHLCAKRKCVMQRWHFQAELWVGMDFLF